MKEMAGPIAVQRTESAFSLDHFAQSGHHRGGRFFCHQLRVVNLAGACVQVIFLAMARVMTSCTFIARSTAALR
jgi:hypothetical protein